VFDNADDPRVLDGLIPHAGSGQVLITSRRSDWTRLGATVRRLDVLPPDDSVALLRTITRRADSEGARLVAEELDGLAVALEQAGAFIRKTGWDYERYLEMLRTRPLSLHSEDLAGVGTTVAKVWESSLDQVTGSGAHGSLAAPGRARGAGVPVVGAAAARADRRARGADCRRPARDRARSRRAGRLLPREPQPPFHPPAPVGPAPHPRPP
jgi:hypothetical protein